MVSIERTLSSLSLNIIYHFNSIALFYSGTFNKFNTFMVWSRERVEEQNRSEQATVGVYILLWECWKEHSTDTGKWFDWNRNNSLVALFFTKSTKNMSRDMKVVERRLAIIEHSYCVENSLPPATGEVWFVILDWCSFVSSTLQIIRKKIKFLNDMSYLDITSKFLQSLGELVLILWVIKSAQLNR